MLFNAIDCNLIVINLFLIEHESDLCYNIAVRKKRGDFLKNKIRVIISISVLIIILSSFFIYTGNFYHADVSALQSLQTSQSVRVVKTDFGWLFDGPSDENALIFYPGAKVEETAYAPMLNLLAEKGVDVCLVKMPLRLSFFGINKAADIISEYGYSDFYIGGHSLGGAMAAVYAAKHSENLSGVILFAAYPTKPIDEKLSLMSIYGDKDGVLNMKKLEEGMQYIPGSYSECEIAGGNHAQFGNYGVQKGDGTALVSAEEQQRSAVEFIIENIH